MDDDDPEPSGFFAAYYTAFYRATILAERVGDETVRDRMRKLRTGIDAVIRAKDFETAHAQWEAMGDTITDSNQSIGDRLRKL